MVVQIKNLGFERPYSAYVPTGPARAFVSGEGFVVNLNGNTLEWFQPIQIRKTTDGAWDEPPKFPGLTNAYFEVIEKTRDAVTSIFK